MKGVMNLTKEKNYVPFYLAGGGKLNWKNCQNDNQRDWKTPTITSISRAGLRGEPGQLCELLDCARHSALPFYGESVTS
jgi:hypothetical protein